MHPVALIEDMPASISVRLQRGFPFFKPLMLNPKRWSCLSLARTNFLHGASYPMAHSSQLHYYYGTYSFTCTQLHYLNFYRRLSFSRAIAAWLSLFQATDAQSER
jgi:hypothetical protein